MLDTNVILSSLLFPSPRMDSMMESIFTHHTLIPSSFVIDELYSVVPLKFPGKETVISTFLNQINFEEGQIRPRICRRDSLRYATLMTIPFSVLQ